MAHLTGVFQRGSAFYLRIVLPKGHPLSARYRNGRFVKSLGTCSHREALQRGLAKRAEVLCGFTPVVQLPALAPVAHTPAPPLAIVVAQPPAAVVVELKPTLTLRGVYEKWKDSKAPSADSENACLRAVVLFEECLGRKIDLHTLTRAQGDTFRAWLLTKDATSKTSRDRFTWVKSLLKYASRDLEAISKSPWEGLNIAHRTTARRRPWSPDELSTLFSQPLFTSYALPKDFKAGKDAAYWIPIIGLYSGARVGELAQLRTEDVITSGPIPLFSITDEGESQRVKSDSGIRVIPIHPELVRLGFLEYVEQVRNTSATALWPAMKMRDGRPGGYFSAWFGTFRKAAGLTEKYPDFHCLRHTVRTGMSRAGIDHKVQDELTGHKPQGSVGTRVYQQVSEDELVKAVAALEYPGLNLPRVFKSAGDYSKIES